jgi:hypothetical protein
MLTPPRQQAQQNAPNAPARNVNRFNFQDIPLNLNQNNNAHNEGVVLRVIDNLNNIIFQDNNVIRQLNFNDNNVNRQLNFDNIN